MAANLFKRPIFRMIIVVVENFVSIAIVIGLTGDPLKGLSEKSMRLYLLTNCIFWLFPCLSYIVFTLLEFNLIKESLDKRSSYMFKMYCYCLVLVVIIFLSDYYVLKDSFLTLTNISIGVFNIIGLCMIVGRILESVYLWILRQKRGSSMV